MAPTDTKTRKLFALDQKLSVLTLPPGESAKKYLDGDRFWHEHHKGRGGDELPEDPWKDISRELLIDRIVSGEYKRLAIVCRGGYGKSANLVYLRDQLKLKDRVPFLFELDGVKVPLPDNLKKFVSHTLLTQVSGTPNARQDIESEEWNHIVEDYRESGQFAFLFDSIDQASENGLQLLQEFLANQNWTHCPAVISARPHAIFDNWKPLIEVPGGPPWTFVRVEPIALPEREFLLGPYMGSDEEAMKSRLTEGAKLYQLLPPAGRNLMANPRNIEFVRRMAGHDKPLSGKQYNFKEMRTASDLFAASVDYTVRYGTKATDAERLGEKRNQSKASSAEDFALDLLAAFAYVMYSRLYEEEVLSPFRPNVTAIPHADMGKVRKAVTKLLKEAEIVEDDYRVSDLEKVDQPALNALNAGVN